MNDEDMQALYARLEAGNGTYEDAAAMWASTVIGRASGVSPADFVERLRAKYPTPEVLGAFLKELISMMPAEIRPSYAAQRKH